MRLIPIDKVKKGDVLANDIYRYHGEVILAKGSKLNRIKDLRSIWIYYGPRQ
mgnify:CR=1 FL=1